MSVHRRLFLAALAAAIIAAPLAGHAKDGGRGGDDGGGDGGHDGGGDDGGHGRDDDGGRDRSRHQDDEWSQDKALKERRLGQVIPLETALRVVRDRVRGRIIDITLAARGGRPQYRVKVRRDDGVIQTIRLDARSGRIIDLMGF